jgi:hypothetical protein
MKDLSFNRYSWSIIALVAIVVSAGCGNIPATVSEGESTPSAAPVAEASPSSEPAATSPSVETSEAQVPVSGNDALYADEFTDPATGWSEDKFDNYFIGYHEPEYYHVEITSPHNKTAVFEPEKRSFADATIELKVLTNSAKTAPSGDFRYGVAFRRSGDQYYAFTISPRSKTWYVLKSSPSGVQILAQGTDEEIHELDTDDLLRVDAQGPTFDFHINDQFVGEVSDADYTTGEVGLYVESFDSPNIHIHFDALTIRDYQAAQPQELGVELLLQDDFTDPASSWPERKFDNYFIGYHEPEYYHVEIIGPSYKTTVFEPQKRSFTDVTAELQVLTAASRTAAEGDFRYGLALRRSGDQYYAFTISPRAKKWYVLKSSPQELVVLAEGTETTIRELDVDDTLRVDAQGSSFLFHINDKLVTQVTDPDYPAGEVGFYVESFDSQNTHIHFDKLTVREVEVSLICDVRALALNVRSGPSTTFSSTHFLTSGDTVEPVGISPDGQWLKIEVKDNPDGGWIFNSPGFLTCNASPELLPVTQP